jgi:hypothetical protein
MIQAQTNGAGKTTTINPFRDFSGLAKYPVDGSQLRESQVVIETYRPADHFTRTVTIPSILLKDWTVEK